MHNLFTSLYIHENDSLSVFKSYHTNMIFEKKNEQAPKNVR